MSVRETATRLMVTCDVDLVEWLKLESGRRDRSLAWLFQESVRQWRNRLERERARKVGGVYSVRPVMGSPVESE